MPSPRILLLQARRPDDPMAHHEVECFRLLAGTTDDNMVPWNLIQSTPTATECKQYDAIFIGGSGDYYVSKQDQSHFEQYIHLIQELISRAHPLFGVCYGYQSIAHALGGHVEHIPEKTEVGSYQARLTTAGTKDELIGQLPARFTVQQGHKDHVTILPPNIVNLAESDRCTNQAFRIGNLPIWGVQFHPELTHLDNKTRFMHYLEGYGSAFSPKETEEIMSRFTESPEASSLLKKFIDLVCPS